MRWHRLQLLMDRLKRSFDLSLNCIHISFNLDCFKLEQSMLLIALKINRQ